MPTRPVDPDEAVLSSTDIGHTVIVWHAGF